MPTAHDAYDAVAYPSFSYPDTHPSRLASMAILHGLSPAPVERCRVLEIACNEGANLIPMAYAMPSSEFVGFDLAGQPIERARQRIRELGLTNIRVFQSDLMDVRTGSDGALGPFDYIIAHGLYAWVPEPVRDRLLALCAELLAPEGVAFVSYNALPGGYLRGMMRSMMLLAQKQTEGIEDPDQRVAQSLGFVRFLIEARPEGDPYRALLEDQLQRIEKRSPRVTFHDELSAAWQPVGIAEFARHAERHRLQYLSESTLPPPNDPSYRAPIRAALESIAAGDILQQEEILDFVRARTYRETLFCRAGRAVRRDFPPERFRLLLASPAISSPAESPESPGALVFTLPGGIRMESNHAAAIALMRALEAAWPRALSVADLEHTLAGSGFTLDADGANLLMRLAIAKMIEFRAWTAPVAAAVSDCPRASASSRQEARLRAYATSLLHTTMALDDPVVRRGLQLLDGTRDRSQLLNALQAEFPALQQEMLAEGLEPGLRNFHRAGFLEA